MAAVAGIIAIIAIASGGNDKSQGDTATSVSGSVASTGASATVETSPQSVTNGVLPTSTSGSGSPTSSTASTTSVPGVIAPLATDSPTSVGGTTPPIATSAQIDLGRAADFAVLGNSAVGNTGPTTVTGQIGASTGRLTGLSATNNPTGIIIVDSQTAQQGQLAADRASSELDGRATTALPASGLGTQRVGPGTYSSAALGIDGTVTLDAGGDPQALFVFESAGTLTVAAASQIVRDGGAQACNVFWRTGSSANLGTGSTFIGTVIADESITVATGTDVVGRFIARNGAVTLDTDSIASPICA